MGILAGSIATRNRERAELRAKISALRKKVTAARELMEQFNRCRRALETHITNWERQYSNYTANELLSQIFVTDRFEGNIAENLSQEFPLLPQKMNTTSGSMQVLLSAMASQVRCLQEYIAKLEEEISSLQAALAAL